MIFVGVEGDRQVAKRNKHKKEKPGKKEKK
jgi:hypothetical protein